MKSTSIIKGLIVIFCMVALPRFVKAADGKPSAGIKINYVQINQLIGDTTVPAKDKKSLQEKTGETKENATEDKPVDVVKVIPNARKQPIPVPVKVNVKPVKIIKPKIIKPVLKPVIKIFH